MKSFSNLCQEYQLFKGDSTFDYDDYFWLLGYGCQQAWWNEFEERVPTATQEEINAYHSTISKGGNLIGMYVADIIPGDKVLLYKKTQVTRMFSSNQFVFSTENQYVTSDGFLVDGNQYYIPNIIKKRSVKVSLPVSMIDYSLSNSLGILLPSYAVHSGSIVSEESIIGYVNYMKGSISFLHSAKYNEDLILNDYEPRCTEPIVLDSKQPYVEPLSDLVRTSVSGLFIYYKNPTENVFTFSLE